MPERILVTGSNRGIGLEFVRQYLERGCRVYATCRRPAEADSLHRLAALHNELSVHRLDVTVLEDIKNICWEMRNIPLDVLINNAGVYFEKRMPGLACGGICYTDWKRTFEVNTLGAVRVTEALVDNVGASYRKLVVALSSHMGGITDMNDPGSYYYRSSKAALNAAMQGMAHSLQGRGIGVLMLHPGGVMTRIGPNAGISARESVQGMRRLINEFIPEQSGSFLKYTGEVMPW